MTRPAVLLMTLALAGCVAAEPITAPPVITPSRRAPSLAAEVDDAAPSPVLRGPAHWPQTLVLAIELDQGSTANQDRASSTGAVELLTAQLTADLGVPVVLADVASATDPAPARIHLRIATLDRALTEGADVLLQGVRDGQRAAPMVWVTADVATCVAVHGPDGAPCLEDRGEATSAADGAAMSPLDDAFLAAVTDGRTIATAARTSTERRYVTETLAAHTGNGTPQVTHLRDLAAVNELLSDEPTAIVALPRDVLLRGEDRDTSSPPHFMLAVGPAVPVEVVAVHRALPDDLVAALRDSFLDGLTDPYRAAAVLDVAAIEAWTMPDPALIDAAAAVAQR